MTTKAEAEWARDKAVAFLEWLAKFSNEYIGFDGPLTDKQRKRVPLAVRREAQRILRHFSRYEP